MSWHNMKNCIPSKSLKKKKKKSKQKWSKKTNTILFLFSFMGNLQVWSLTFTLYVNLVLKFQMYQFSP